MSQKATVIGAGLGGLAASALLARQGYAVSVYEKNNSPGGKMQQISASGYRFDTGPSLLTMPFILKKLFEQCGKDIRQYISWTESVPLCRYFYGDGTQFDNFAERNKTVEEINRFAPEDSESYSTFLDYSEDLYHRTADAFLFNPLYSLSDLKHLNFVDFLQIDAFSTVSEIVDEYFSSPYLRQFFKRFTTYNGSSPFKAPATLNVIPHVELNQGGYYVKGGLYQIALALQKLAVELGVKFHYDMKITSISIDGKSVKGIKTENNYIEECDLLFANSDATDTILNLIPKSSVSPRKTKKHQTIEPSCSGFVMLLGCNRQWNQLRHHNIYFSKDYEQEFDDIFEKRQMPADPTIYIANTSYTDPDHAPPHSSNLFILVNAPYVTNKQNWTEIGNTYSTFLIDLLEKKGVTDLRESIEFSDIITPRDFLQTYGSNRGSIYGTSSNSKFAAFLRPRNKIRELENLYLVGGSTHPGGGIPLVVQSAFNAMELLRRDRTRP
ncbi:phytoene desaturase family protein [soil metagenome]